MQRRIVVGALLALVSLTPVLAHHSAAMFDLTKTVVIHGTVTRFQWTNPHSWLYVTGKTPDGAVQDWSIEMTSPNLMARAGWRPSVIQPGNQITIVGNPLRDGSAGAQFKCAVLDDGRVLTYQMISLPSANGDSAAAVAACRGDNTSSGSVQ